MKYRKNNLAERKNERQIKALEQRVDRLCAEERDRMDKLEARIGNTVNNQLEHLETMETLTKETRKLGKRLVSLEISTAEANRDFKIKQIQQDFKLDSGNRLEKLVALLVVINIVLDVVLCLS